MPLDTPLPFDLEAIKELYAPYAKVVNSRLKKFDEDPNKNESYKPTEEELTLAGDLYFFCHLYQSAKERKWGYDFFVRKGVVQMVSDDFIKANILRHSDAAKAASREAKRYISAALFTGEEPIDKIEATAYTKNKEPLISNILLLQGLIKDFVLKFDKEKIKKSRGLFLAPNEKVIRLQNGVNILEEDYMKMSREELNEKTLFVCRIHLFAIIFLFESIYF